MKIKALLVLAVSFLAIESSLQAGPAVKVFIGGNACGNAGFVRPAPIICRPAPVVFQRPPLCPTIPIVYQTYGPLCPSPIYYGIGPTTITYTSGPAANAPVTPLVVPPPVIFNRPVVVYQGTTFSWKH